VAEHRRNTVVPSRCGILGEDVQHELNISTLLDTFSGAALRLSQPPLRSETQLRTEENAFNRATGADSPRRDSREGPQNQ
jgi:hypothetical protein